MDISRERVAEGCLGRTAWVITYKQLWLGKGKYNIFQKLSNNNKKIGYWKSQQEPIPRSERICLYDKFGFLNLPTFLNCFVIFVDGCWNSYGRKNPNLLLFFQLLHTCLISIIEIEQTGIQNNWLSSLLTKYLLTFYYLIEKRKCAIKNILVLSSYWKNIGLCIDFCTETYKISLTELNYKILF